MRSDFQHTNWLLDVGNGAIQTLEISDSWKSSVIIQDIYDAIHLLKY